MVIQYWLYARVKSIGSSLSVGVLAFEGEAGVLPRQQASLEPADVFVAGIDEILVELQAGVTSGVRAVNDDLLVRLDRRRLLDARDVFGSRDALRAKLPVAQSVQESELIAA